jgi:N-methylhydantoinase A
VAVRLGVDVGGTFTDLVALGPRGLTVAKVLSTPDAPERGIWDAYEVAELREVPGALIHGTTIATNALLERKGARVVLVATEGFEDLLELRRQDRASLYDLARHHPPPLVPRERVVGVRERTGPGGVVVPLTDVALGDAVERVRALQPESVAVSLLFAFRHPEHEARVAAALRAALPGVPVIASSELVPRVREYERTATVAAEAFLRPRVGRYVERFAADAAARGLGAGAARVLASNGGALRPALAAERAVWLALSGPAGGIQGAAMVGAASGFTELLTLDMGGTSADAGVVRRGAADTRTHGAIAGFPLAVPHIFIETVSAGGGSIGWLDSGGALRVGPESAGAVPGPACYDRGGTRATVTDAFVALGWIRDGATLGGSIEVSRARAAEAIGSLAATAGLEPSACALGMIRIAEASMARALRRVSVERGLDPSGMTLVAFGGAGPLSGCALADLLGVRRVLFPPHAGALSALGMAAADDVVEHAASVHLPVAEFVERAGVLAAPLVERVRAELPGAAIGFVAECRYARQGYELDVPCGAGTWERLAADFHAVHQRAFGHHQQDGEILVVALRAVGTLAAGAKTVRWPRRSLMGGTLRLQIHLDGDEVDAAGYDWESLRSGQLLAGPAVVEGRSATGLIPAGWTGQVNAIGAVVVEANDAGPG